MTLLSQISIFLQMKHYVNSKAQTGMSHFFKNNMIHVLTKTNFWELTDGFLSSRTLPGRLYLNIEKL